MSDLTATETLLKRDRLIVGGGLLAIFLLACGYTGWFAWLMHQMPMTELRPWSPGYALLMVSMWIFMMIAMMIPSATPTILLYARVHRHNASRLGTSIPTSAFLAGYLFIWSLFGLVATGLQWGLEQLALLSPMMVSSSALFGGSVLILAGIYQLSPIKDACLRHCQTPAHFLSKHWQNGKAGAFRMGIEHGLYCLGCCWVLMLLLFVGGVMNIIWIALIMMFVLIEKVHPFGKKLGVLSACLMMASGLAGIWMGFG